MKIQRHPYTTHNPELDGMIDKLIAKASGNSDYEDLLKEMIITAVKLKDDEIERGDLKMMTVALKELRYALKVFYPFRHVRKIALFGSARTLKTSPDYKQAVDFARQIAASGWMVVTGAASGIMSAGNEGAGRANSFGVNIRLPFEQEANPVIKNDSKLINFKYFFTRKLIFIRETDATILFPGGFGTHDEGFETLTLVQTGKTNPRPIVCLDPPKSTYWTDLKKYLHDHLAKKHLIDPEDMNLIHFTHSVSDAVRYVTSFYRNYHSMRYIGDRLVMRLKHPLTKKHLERINDHYNDLCCKGKIQQFAKPFEEEKNEPHTFDLTRLAFYSTKRNFARLNSLIHCINDLK